MGTWRIGRQNLKRTAILATIAASLVLAAPQGAGASPASDAGAKGDTFAAMCRAAGGEATWTTSIDPTGTVTYIVECDGGYLDGLNCFFDEQFTDCTQSRFGGRGSSTPIEPAGIEPLDDPGVDLPGSAEEPVTIAPVEQETTVVDVPEGADATATPTPEPTAEDPTEVSGEVVDGSAVDDEAIIDEVVEPGEVEEPGVRDPVFDDGRFDGVENIGPGEVVTLT